MILKVFFFVLGSVVGSFLNVCIHRLPSGESIVKPGSHCPKCGKHIAWYDNIPMLSYILLKRRCRHCGAGISGRYFVVELLTACIFLALFLKFGLSVSLFIYLAFASSLIAMSFIDFAHKIIPDILDCPGIPIGLVLSVLHPSLHVRPEPWDRIFSSARVAACFDSVSGIVLGGGILVLLALAGKAVFKKEAMGGGDVKLLAMIGAFLGWQMVLLTILISSLIGSLVGILMKLKTTGSYIPYGPYLALGALISIFHGEKMISWYLSRLG